MVKLFRELVDPDDYAEDETLQIVRWLGTTQSEGKFAEKKKRNLPVEECKRLKTIVMTWNKKKPGGKQLN